MAATGIPVDEVALRRPTLDDAFIALTGGPATAADPDPATTPSRWPHDRRGDPAVDLRRETLLLTGRSLRAIPRVPERLLDVTIQPIMFIVLFLYVFGSAIHVHGVGYKDYLFPGIIAQSLAFGVIGSGIGHLQRHERRGDRPLPFDAGRPAGDHQRLR